jgi:hypothetical protein
MRANIQNFTIAKSALGLEHSDDVVQPRGDKSLVGELLAQPSGWKDRDDATCPSLSTQLQ